MSELLTWVNVGGGGEKPDWVYVVVRYRDGQPDFSVQPRWATKRDVRRRRGPPVARKR
jgi:hypothetical protein